MTLAAPGNLWTPSWTPTRPNGLTFTDFLCGAGGSAIGLVASGYTLVLGINHWKIAVETHARNFRLAEHLCQDISAISKKALPRTHVLFAGIICTESSPAGGKRKKRGAIRPDHITIDGEQYKVDEAGWEATRATAYDTLAAIEAQGYLAVLIENVLEFATDWPLFLWWLQAAKLLGYNHHIVSANSAHIWDDENPPAPQWRDRIYILLLREGFTMPVEELEPRPLAYCFDCREQVHARQTWKNTPFTRKHGRIGKYGVQYYYTCPNTSRRHTNPIVEPYILPAISAIDWSDPGVPIGERHLHKKPPLVPNTLRRIDIGYDMVREGPTTLRVPDSESFHPWTRPHPGPAGGDGASLPPYMIELHGGGSTARPIDHPMATVTTGGKDGGTHHGLVIPGEPMHWDPDGYARLVIPYRKNSRARSSREPLPTISTIESAGVLTAARDVPMEQRYYRTVRWYENLAAQRFPADYEVLGNSGEKNAQAGNAVCSNVTKWLGDIVARALGAS